MSASAKEDILRRIRSGVADLSTEQTPARDVAVPWTYGRPTAMPDLVERFVERVEDYRARVIRCGPQELGQQLAEVVAELGVATAVVPSGVPSQWLDAALPTLTAVFADEPALRHAQLDAIDAVVTAARVGIAETGTIVLDHTSDQGRRALTLVPDVHICVVRADQIVSDVPEAVAVLGRSVAARLPLTWISGPSATSDIELDRVEGVHGPRTLVVIVTD